MGLPTIIIFNDDNILNMSNHFFNIPYWFTHPADNILETIYMINGGTPEDIDMEELEDIDMEELEDIDMEELKYIDTE